jgi:hypothetical protein
MISQHAVHSGRGHFASLVTKEQKWPSLWHKLQHFNYYFITIM